MPYKNKEDQAASARRHYERNKKAMKKRAGKYRDKYRAEVYELINKRKSEIPCTDCKQFFHPVQMDYDHLENDKIDSVGTMIANVRPLRIIEAEIKKCELVCANCHRLRHHNRRLTMRRQALVG